MGEESTTPVYIGKYEDGAVRFEPLGEFKVIDHDITDVCHDDMVKTTRYIRTIMKEPITLKLFLRKKGSRGFYKAIGMPAYLRTEYLFPKKKKRGTARRKRRMKRYKQSLINFINAKYGSGLIGTDATHTIIDEFIISRDELPAFAEPPVSREEYLEKASFSAPWPGPFEGEED